MSMNKTSNLQELKVTSARSLNELDTVIGRRIKMARINCGMSQVELARQLNLSVQMLQRYERGLNRVSASRLRDLARIVKCDFEYFVANSEKMIAIPNGNSGRSSPSISDSGDGSLSQAMELLSAFNQIKEEDIKNTVIALVKSIAAR